MTRPWKRRLRTMLCCTVLEIGALFGVPMRAEEVERLLRSLGAPKIAHTEPEEEEKGKGRGPRERKAHLL